MREKLIVLFVVLAIPVAIIILSQRRMSLFTYDGYTLEYDAISWQVDFEEPKEVKTPSWSMKSGSLLLTHKDGAIITFSLQDKKIVDPQVESEIGVLTTDSNTLFFEQYKDYLYCVNSVTGGFLCNLKSLGQDGLLYDTVVNILGFAHTRISISTNSMSDKESLNIVLAEIDFVIEAIHTANGDTL